MPEALSFRSAGLLALLAALLSAPGCAIRDRSSIDASWASAERPAAPFRKVLILTVALDEFVQADFQKQMAARLQAKGMNAVASGRYFTRYVEAEKERFRQVIAESDADAVLVTRVTTTESTSRDGPDFSLYVYPTAVKAQQDYTLKTLTTEASLFDRRTEKLLWSARARTKNAGTGDRDAAIADYVNLLVKAMERDKVL